MKSFIVVVIAVILMAGKTESKADETTKSLSQITNFYFVSKQLASSGLLEFDKYQDIKKYGFKHVINLIPGNQDKERAIVSSLGLSYKQIPVEWSEPTLENFEIFLKLMKKYSDEKIYVHCEANFRASTFVYLYRILELGLQDSEAKKDLLKIWTPSETWQDYIEKVKFSHQD